MQRPRRNSLPRGVATVYAGSDFGRNRCRYDEIDQAPRCRLRTLGDLPASLPMASGIRAIDPQRAPRIRPGPGALQRTDFEQ